MKRKVFLFIVLFVVAGISSSFAVDLPAEQSAAGIKTLVPDVWVFQLAQDNKGNWEPYTDIFGDGTILVGGNTFPDGLDGMNMKVAFVNPKTGKVDEYWGFYSDAGKAYTGQFNEKRIDGNPSRVAADRRAGKARYAVGMEATPQYYDEFNTDNRWFRNFDYDAQVAVVQLFDKTDTGPKPITNVIDPLYMPGDVAGAQGGAQMRFGGDIQFLSNGNFLAVVEDRSKTTVTGGNGSVGSVFDNDGKLIKGPFNCAGDDGVHDQWSNVAAFNGGFCVRASNIFTVFDNSGNMLYWFDQADFSTVAEKGRGDGVRIGSNFGTNYVYFAGKDANGDMVVTRFDAVATKTGDALQDVKEILANEIDFVPGTFDRCDIGVDNNGNFCVAYMDSSVTGTSQIVARVFDNKMDPKTPTFFAFTKHDGLTGDVEGFIGKAPNVSMDNQSIVIAADGVNWDTANNALTPNEINYFTVLENPLKTDTLIRQWDLY